LEIYNGELRWMWARLDSVTGTNIPKTGLYLPLTITFSIQSQHWNGAWHDDWLLDSGLYFDDSLYFDSDLIYPLSAIIVPNNGNIDVEDCIITVTAQTSSITNLVIERISQAAIHEHLIYTGTILATKSLVIDCGAGSVKNDGVGDSAHFSRGADHKYDGWFKLESGSNVIQVISTGGGATSSIEFNFYDGWE
jgi:hypothetical protein